MHLLTHPIWKTLPMVQHLFGLAKSEEAYNELQSLTRRLSSMHLECRYPVPEPCTLKGAFKSPSSASHFHKLPMLDCILHHITVPLRFTD